MQTRKTKFQTLRGTLLATTIFVSPVYAQQIPDLDGDGQISFDEFALALRDRLQNYVVEDRDGDGMIDRDELIQATVGLWHAIQGDLNGDGVVDESDLAIVGMNQGLVDVSYTRGDLDLDGDVDTDDFLINLSLIGTQLAGNDAEAVRAIAFVSSYAATIETETADNSTHRISFSATWPLDHDSTLSDFWPLNHDGEISGQWNRNDHTHNILQSEHWPANHLYVNSQSWDQSGHDVDVSAWRWPPNHWFRVSLDWPDDHLSITSRIWPSNHIAMNSSLGEPSDHHVVPSGRWHHDQDLSMQQWPSHHDMAVSRGWLRHDQQTSLLWPPNHFHGPSDTWGGDHSWPVNHFRDMSDLWGTPAHEAQFPTDHALFTTLRNFSNTFSDTGDDE